jgi:hypothetical protein
MAGHARIRVAFCIDDFTVGGSQLKVQRTAEALDPRGVELRVYYMQKHGPLDGR